jgi:hypothetical protein
LFEINGGDCQFFYEKIAGESEIGLKVILKPSLISTGAFFKVMFDSLLRTS